MTRANVDAELLRIALDRASGIEFERFVQAFFAAELGSDFAPLGGTHDGGADAVLLPGVLIEAADPRHFLQVSIEEDIAGKIRQTVKRLREVGREPNAVTYITSRRVPLLDQVGRRLSEELGLYVQLRDRPYIEAHINDSNATQAAFESYLAPLTAFLKRVGGRSISVSQHVKSPAVYVFLRQELDRRSGETTLTDAMVDALIVWALEGTDPDQGRFMTRTEIFEKVLVALPAVRQIVKERLDTRLEALAEKDHPGGRGVRWHQGQDLFALPYEARSMLAAENAEDEALRIAVRERFEERLRELLGDALGTGSPKSASQVAMRSVELMFETEGLEFAQFVTGKAVSGELPTVSDAVTRAMDDLGIPGANRIRVEDAVLETLRVAFYDGSDEERLYFERLARTYSLLFTLQADPQVVRYFEELAGDFYLYVGADMLVRALSERYLQPKDQMMRNTLAMARDAGATLVLTEPVLEEVINHLKVSDREFAEHFATVDNYITVDITRHSDKILIRAYYYAKLNPMLESRPTSWQQYISQFCPVSELSKMTGYGYVKTYLQGQFGLKFETRGELEELTTVEEVTSLTEDLSKDKANPALARNDALVALAVYGRRAELKEYAETSEFGYRTWWLTGESTILKYTNEIVRAHHGERYMMRPEFLLHFIALAPSVAEVRRSYANVFPSVLGVRLGRRMDSASFQKLIHEVEAAQELEEGARKARISQIVDQLKAGFRRPS